MPHLTNVVVKVAVFDEQDNLLLIRRSETDKRRPLQWDVPGGMVDEGEDYSVAAARELSEETGIVVPVNELEVVYSTSEVTDYGNTIWIYFVCRVQNAEPTLSSEHDQSEWVPMQKALQTIEYERMSKALRYIADNNLLPPQ